MRKKWMALGLSALLVLTSLLGCSQQAEKGNEKMKYAVAQAEYPKMASYPDEMSFVDEKTGEWDDTGFSKVYEAWEEDRRAQRMWAVEGYQDGLMAFCEATMPTFLVSEGENRVYSPLNLYMALAMLAEVTEGDSRQQVLDLLCVENIETLREKVAALWNVNYCKDGAVTSVLANSLWLDDEIGYNEKTLERLAKTYYASAFSGEMGSEDYNQALRDWINEQTGGLLKEQADGLEMDPMCVLALASTIYFQAKWSNEFYNEAEPGIFHGAGGDTDCEYLKESQAQNYYWSEQFAAVAKGLEGSGNMWLFLPDEGVTPEDLLADPDVLSLVNGAGSWENSKHLMVNLSLPKFDVTSDVDLCEGLKELGVVDVFDAGASDFTPLTEEVEEIFVSEAKHAARVAVDEQGVTAAAYTVMIMCGAGLPPTEEVDFVLDRPFLFVLTGEDGSPLFIGVVNQV